MTPSAVHLDAFDRYAVMANGHTVHLRPASPDDAAGIRRFYERLGDTSTYYRFFGLRRAIPDGEVAALVGSELPGHATLVACVADEIVGVGEFHQTGAPATAEVAFAVSDDQQGHGIATLLLEDLALVAAQVGIRRFVAETLPGNAAMQLVFRTAGLSERHRFDDGLMDVVIDLDDRDGLRREAAARESVAVAVSLAAFFRPRHVAVFGDAGRGTAAARRVTGALGALFTGWVSIVDPAAPAVAPTSTSVPPAPPALVRVRSLDDLDSVPDLAVVATVAAQRREAVEACARAGIRAALLVTTDPESDQSSPADVAVEPAGWMVDAAHRLDLRILGPGAGVAVPSIGLVAMSDPRPFADGSVAVLARGHRAASAMQHALARRGLGVSAFVSLGAPSDVVTEDLLCWWAHDASTRVILIDSDREVGSLSHRARRTLQLVAAHTPVITLTEYTDARESDPLTGPVRRIDADGIVHAADRAHLLDLGAFFSTASAPEGPRLAVVTSWETSPTETSTVATAVADAVAIGLSAAVLGAATVAALGEIVQVSVTPGCVALPPDASTDVDVDRAADRVADALLASGEVDVCLVRRHRRLSVELRAGSGETERVDLGEAGWRRGLDVIASAWAWSAHTASVQRPPDELYRSADGAPEPLR